MNEIFDDTALETKSHQNTEWGLLAPSEETLEFVQSARAHFGRLFPPSVLRAIAAGDDPPIQAWPELVEQGYTAVGLPDDIGGIGTLVDLVAVLEEAGHALIPLPLLASAASAQTLLHAGFDPQSLTVSPSALVVAGGSEGTLIVLDATHAATITVVSPTPDGVIVERITGSTRPTSPPDPIDPTRPLVIVERETTLDERNLAAVSVDAVLAAARVCVAADLIGIATLAIEGATEHAKQREQFGRPIGAFQAVKHQLADSHVSIERARSLALGAAAELVARPLGAVGTELAMLAKATASEAATRAVALQTQLLGAMGLTYESDNHLAVRRARQTAGYLGTASDLYAGAATLALKRTSSE